jgi:hypothetical protein
MKLKEIFDQLTYGELSQMELGGMNNDSPGIEPSRYPMIVNHINLGLNALYQRFPLKESIVKVELMPGIYTYNLRSSFSENSLVSFEDNFYIKDTEDSPFQDDLIKVERVYTDTGMELGLNDENDSLAIITPSLQSIRVPEAIVNQSQDLPRELITKSLKVVYRASHPMLRATDTINPSSIEVELPYSHLEALLYFVASRLHNPIGMTNEFHAGNSYAAKYEMVCQRLEAQNIRADQFSQSSSRLERGGWV